MSEPALLGARRLHEQLQEHGIRPRRELGQNFVIDPNTIRKVVDLARVDHDATVLEIGAGVGSLTLGLAAAAERVIAVEVDERLTPLLAANLDGVDNVEIVVADALHMDVTRGGPTKLVGNLPYNIAVPLVMKVLTETRAIRSLTVMTQREVGERLAAPAGDKVYGQVSVLVRYFAEASVAARISRTVFYPVPNVDSVVVRIDRRREPVEPSFASFAPVVKGAFAQRRKTLRKSLAALAGSVDAARDLCDRAGVDPGRRAEEVDLDGFLALARAFR